MSYVEAGKVVTVPFWRQQVQMLSFGDTSTPGTGEVRMFLESGKYVLKVWNGTAWIIVGSGFVDAATVGGETIAQLHNAANLTGVLGRARLSTLWWDGDAGIGTYPYIQTGRGYYSSASSITFPYAYSTTPRLFLAVEQSSAQPEARIYTLTTTGFQLVVQRSPDGAACLAYVLWLAIGQKY